MQRLILLWIVVGVMASGCAKKIAFEPEFKPMLEKVAGPCQIGEDHDGDEIIDARFDFTYLKGGKLQSQEYDRGNDGTIEEKTVYRYAGGRLQQVSTDRGNDGTIDRTEFYSYDLAGKATVSINGQKEKQIEYDRLGRMVKESFDRNHDGNCDRAVSYIYNAEGLMVEQNRDSDCDGQADRRISYTPGTDGRITEEAMIDVTSNQLFAVISYHYTGNRLVKEKKDNGQTYEIVEERYDLYGNLLSKAYFNAGKSLQRKKIYTYGCWN